jgi:hypothetical protein
MCSSLELVSPSNEGLGIEAGTEPSTLTLVKPESDLTISWQPFTIRYE